MDQTTRDFLKAWNLNPSEKLIMIALRDQMGSKLFMRLNSNTLKPVLATHDVTIVEQTMKSLEQKGFISMSRQGMQWKIEIC